MTEPDALALARKLMDKHGLKDWTPRINRRLKRALGRTRFQRKWIELNNDFVALNFKWQVEGVILHEIAHALVGAGHDHDSVFVAACQMLKAPPEFHGPKAVGKIKSPPPPPMRFMATCPSCNKVFKVRKLKAGSNYYCNMHRGWGEHNILKFGHIVQ